MPVKHSAIPVWGYIEILRNGRLPSAVAEDDTVNLDQEIDLLERDFQSRGDTAGWVAFAIHAESLRPFAKIQTGVRGCRNGAALRLALEIRQFRCLIVPSLL